VREHLEIYSALKGIPSRIRRKLIDKQIVEMDLSDFEHVKVETLSGGNKRKVSVSIAMIGNPPIVFLDEPSTGVDPQAKRFMWDVISKISVLRKKSAVIITTHAMEEAEALCTKIGIMVAGNFKCFGSSQYIKDKYGTGFEIEFKIRQYKDQEIEKTLVKHGLIEYETLDDK
jgi:ATP-binding cassette, subfamily A (ABC1), member 3